MVGSAGTGRMSRRSTMGSGEGTRSRRQTIAQTAAKYYAPQTQHLSTSHHHRNFARMLKTSGGEVPRVAVDSNELRRFSLVQVTIQLKVFSHTTMLIFRLIMHRNCSMHPVQILIVEQQQLFSAMLFEYRLHRIRFIHSNT